MTDNEKREVEPVSTSASLVEADQTKPCRADRGRTFKTVIFIAACSLVALAASAVNIYGFASGMGCLVLHLTGIPCPGCGLTRANFAFIRGDIAAAFSYHPMFFMPYLIVGCGALCLFSPKRRRAALGAMIAVLAIFVSLWAVRVIFLGWWG